MRWAAALVGGVLVLAGCAAPVATPRAVPASSPVLRVVAVGDSITEADSPDFDTGQIGEDSWAWWATGDGVDVLGGWAHAGATTADMAAGVQPMDADVLVLMAGNNDVDLDVPTDEVLDHLVAIAGTAGVPRVLLSAVAPEDGRGPEVRALDRRLQRLAREQGWQWVDPMTGVRAPDGGYAPGDSDDGVHPSGPAARSVGEDLRTALLS